LEKLRILIAEKSVLNRKYITEAVNSTEHGIVIHAASNAQIAAEWLKQSAIDVVLMDASLIFDDGISFIQRIMCDHPTVEIIVLSDNTHDNAAITLEAINAGVMDFIVKPSAKETEQWNLIIKNKMETIFTQIRVKHFLPTAKNGSITFSSPNAERNVEKVKSPVEQRQSRSISGNVDLVLFASSTGGPMALDVICRQLPASFKKPVLIVQHMPPEFTSILAETLDKKYSPTVIEGKTGDTIKDGQIIIAPGGFHMVMDEQDERGKKIRIIETQFVNGVRPSADVLFESVAKVHKGKNVLVVVLTGMGNDGTKGIRELKEYCNCYCITQSEASCVVYGMPKCVYEAGYSDEVADLKDIAFRINQITNDRGV
jgi:two-component system chemotaxis response regulator CheB